MTAKANSTPENQGKKHEREVNHKLIALDFKYYDVTEVLTDLLEMAKAGRINGLIFAARTDRDHGEPYLFGASGRLDENQAEAIGAAVLLQHKLAAAQG